MTLLLSRGKLSFENNIHTILELSSTQLSKDIQIKHLLTHTSGIADDADETKGEDFSALFIDTPNYAFRENKDFLPNFAYKEADFKPGEKIYYNNCAFILLGLIIEKITGKRYRDFITEEIFQTFHMNHTFFAAKEDSDKPFAEGYYFNKNNELKKNIYSFPPIGTADSGAYTTVTDLDIFIRQINNSPIYRKMLSPQTNLKIQENNGYYTMGFGFDLLESKGKIVKAYKEGRNAGVRNITAFYPANDVTFTILGNVDSNVWQLHEKSENILFNESI